MFSAFKEASDMVLFLSSLFIMFGSIYLSFKTKFVQLRLFSALRKMILTSKASKEVVGEYTISPVKALLAAMSTTIGIGIIVGPIFAMHFGGPGALLGFLLTCFFGSAATYTEVGLSLKYRKKLENGQILGGPMQYLKVILSSRAANWYAMLGAFLMAIWSASQANQLAAVLDSPLLGEYRIPTYISGSVLAIVVLFILFGGIKRVGAFSAKLVPVMFVLYMSSTLWILALNYQQVPDVLYLIFKSALEPYALASGAVVGGLISTLRWGIFKGTQGTEAGIGTQTIPHSMAETKDPEAQAMLAMVSTYTAGIIAFLSGMVALLTDTWQDPNLPVGISMVAASFQMYFSNMGLVLVAINTVLFAFGTILGNSFNGGQCFGYMTENKKLYAYYAVSALAILGGTLLDSRDVWSYIDIGMACLVVPHMYALVRYAYYGVSEERAAELA